MGDLISRKALMKEFTIDSDGNRIPEYDCDNFSVNISLVDVKRIIYKQPPVEAVPVIRCKDCEHWGTGVVGETDYAKCCEYGKYMVGKNGYCCYADMRKKAQDE